MKDLKVKKKAKKETKKKAKAVFKWKGDDGWPPMIRFVMNGGRIV